MRNQNTETLVKELRDIFIEWDPIGVLDDDDWPKDEYDKYVLNTLSLLADKKSTKDIENYLFNITENDMGIGGNKEEAIKVTKKIFIWWDNVDTKIKQNLELIY